MLKSITKKVVTIVVFIVFLTISLLSSVNFFFSYKQTLTSTGLELIGCANITTGIIDVEELAKLIDGEEQYLDSLTNQLNWTVEHKNIFDSEYIVSMEGKVLVGDEHLAKIGVAVGDVVPESKQALESIRAGHTYYTGIYEINGYKRQTGYAPIYRNHDKSSEVIAMTAIDFDAAIITTRVWEANRISLLVGIVLPIFAAILTMILVSRMLSPIKEIQKHVQQVSEGTLSLSDLPIRSQDELGFLAGGFNRMLHSLVSLISEIRTTTQQLNGQSQELLASSEQAQQNSTIITDAMNSSACSVNEQANLMQRANSHLNEMSANIQHISEGITAVSLVATETNQLSQSGNTLIDQTLSQMDEIHQTTEEIHAITLRLNQRSQEINKIMTVITDISEQTNILALNAAIEASRANEHGEGFLVVAEEVRRLSDNIQVAIQQVSTIIGELQTDSNDSVEKVTVGQSAVKKGVSLLAETRNSFEAISTTVSKTAVQSQTLKEENESIKNELTMLVEEIEHVTLLAEQISSSSQMVASSGEEQQLVMEEFVEVARNLAMISDELTQSIHRFKV